MTKVARTLQWPSVVGLLLAIVVIGWTWTTSAVAALPQSSPLLGSVGIAEEACVDLVQNGGFEQGPANPVPWVLRGFTHVSEERAHRGYFGAWLGGYRDASDTLWQQLVIPAGASTATLRYWWHMDSLDDLETPYDHLRVALRTPEGELVQELETLDNTLQRSTWSQSAYDVSSYAGETLRIHFRCVGNGTFVTSFFLDDVELEVCGAFDTPTPTTTPGADSTATPTVVPTIIRYLPLVWRDAAD